MSGKISIPHMYSRIRTYRDIIILIGLAILIMLCVIWGSEKMMMDLEVKSPEPIIEN